MNRDEILSKSRIDNRGGDERERKITEESGVWGAVAMAMAVAAVFMVRVLTKGGGPCDLLAILFTYLAAANAFIWSRTRSSRTLLVAALYGAFAIGWLCAYVVMG
jgi:apolipoprotein N-acyltransferase